jgi:hypothetical protein
MDDIEHSFGTAVFIFDHTVQKVSAHKALQTFGDMTQENFWRMWPQIKMWCDAFWDEIEEDRGIHSQPHDDDDPHELGEGG